MHVVLVLIAEVELKVIDALSDDRYVDLVRRDDVRVFKLPREGQLEFGLKRHHGRKRAGCEDDRTRLKGLNLLESYASIETPKADDTLCR